MIKELEQDAKTYGDVRRSPIVTRHSAALMIDTEKAPSEPVTIVLSNKGWIRVAKGHEMDPTTLSYKTGDEFKLAVHGKSDDPVVVLDSTGRAYTLSVAGLPNARGQGEPLTGRINPPNGAIFESLLMGTSTDRYLVLSNVGYGFIVPFDELLGKNRNGKTIVKLKEGQTLLSALKMPALSEKAWVALLSQEGKLLLFPMSLIPEMTKGKGNKLFSLGKGKYIFGARVVTSKQSLILKTDRKTLTLSPKDWKPYVGTIGDKGQKLPKGFEKIQKLTVE